MKTTLSFNKKLIAVALSYAFLIPQAMSESVTPPTTLLDFVKVYDPANVDNYNTFLIDNFKEADTSKFNNTNNFPLLNDWFYNLELKPEATLALPNNPLVMRGGTGGSITVFRYDPQTEGHVVISSENNSLFKIIKTKHTGPYATGSYNEKLRDAIKNPPGTREIDNDSPTSSGYIFSITPNIIDGKSASLTINSPTYLSVQTHSRSFSGNGNFGIFSLFTNDTEKPNGKFDLELNDKSTWVLNTKFDNPEADITLGLVPGTHLNTMGPDQPHGLYISNTIKDVKVNFTSNSDLNIFADAPDFTGLEIKNSEDQDKVTNNTATLNGTNNTINIVNASNVAGVNLIGHSSFITGKDSSLTINAKMVYATENSKNTFFTGIGLSSLGENVPISMNLQGPTTIEVSTTGNPDSHPTIDSKEWLFGIRMDEDTSSNGNIYSLEVQDLNINIDALGNGPATYQTYKNIKP